MIEDELSEIDSWLSLSFHDFAHNVVSEMIARCLGIMGHSDLLAMSVGDEQTDLEDLRRQLKGVVAPHFERLKALRMELHTHNVSGSDLRQREEFLQTLIHEMTLVAEDVDRLINQVPPSQSRASSVWNIKENNLPRLRRLVHVCSVYCVT
jgi:hypothetical protein